MAQLAKQSVSKIAKQWVEKEAERLGCSQADVIRRLIEAAMSSSQKK